MLIHRLLVDNENLISKSEVINRGLSGNIFPQEQHDIFSHLKKMNMSIFH